MSTLIPELDASAQIFNIRMTEGDPINFQWLVPDASVWAGTYVFKVRIRDDILELDNTVIAVDDDALFTVLDSPQPTLLKSTSGYYWDIQQVSGPTRFAGLLFVDRQT